MDDGKTATGNQGSTGFGSTLKKCMEVICVVIMAVMACMVFFNVVLRYVFNSSLTSSEELSRFLFVWLTFIGAILAYQEKSHICVDFIVKKFGAGTQRFFKILVDVLIIVICFFIIKGSIAMTVLGLSDLSPVTRIPMAILYFSGIVGGTGICLIALMRLWVSLTGGEE